MSGGELMKKVVKAREKENGKRLKVEWRKGANAFKRRRNASLPSVPLLEQWLGEWTSRNPTQQVCKHHYKTSMQTAEWAGQQQGKTLICYVVVVHKRTWTKWCFHQRNLVSKKNASLQKPYVRLVLCTCAGIYCHLVAKLKHRPLCLELGKIEKNKYHLDIITSKNVNLSRLDLEDVTC